MEQKIELKVGIFIIVSTLLILSAIGYVAIMKGIFSKTYTYTLKSSTGENITKGMPVHFLGFEIGKVSSLKLDEEENAVLVEIKIPEKNKNALRLGSKFRLDTPLLGSPRIIVETANLNAEPLPEEGFSKISYDDDIDELISRGWIIADKTSILMESLTEVISNMTKVTENLLVFQGNLNSSMENIEKFTSRYSENESLLEVLTGSQESAVNIQEFASNLNDISERTNEMLIKFDSLAEKADGSIYGEEGIFPLLKDLLKDLAVTMDNFSKVSGETAHATKDLTDLRNKVDETINSIRNLVDDLDRLVPFKDESGVALP